MSLILSCHLCLLLIGKCQHGFNDYDGFNCDPFGTLQTNISHIQASKSNCMHKINDNIEPYFDYLWKSLDLLTPTWIALFATTGKSLYFRVGAMPAVGQRRVQTTTFEIWHHIKDRFRADPTIFCIILDAELWTWVMWLKLIQPQVMNLITLINPSWLHFRLDTFDLEWLHIFTQLC